MIHKVYPSLNDFENFSRLRVSSSEFANTFDYKNVVVNKPWGYEYLWFQNEAVAIWFLYIKKDHGTSLHCHAHKRTSLIVLDGMVQCTTLDDKYKMTNLEGIVLEPCVFHTSQALSNNGAFIMEIETPPMKGDLVRMNDSYGRQNSGYEKTEQYSSNFGAYDFYPLSEDADASWKFKDIQIKVATCKPVINNDTILIVPINGHVKAMDKIAIECGEAVMPDSNVQFDKIDHTDYKFLIFSHSQDKNND